jgi:hypothetical protein
VETIGGSRILWNLSRKKNLIRARWSDGVGIEEVNQAVIQKDESTHQNAVPAEEAAASAEAMQEQAGSLTRAVSAFKLDTRRQGVRGGR